MQRPIQKIRNLRTHRGGADNGGPEQGWMVFPCTDLRKQKGQEKSARHPQPDEIAEAEGLGDEITGRFAQRRGNDLDDPEGERDFGDLVQGVGVGR